MRPIFSRFSSLRPIHTTHDVAYKRVTSNEAPLLTMPPFGTPGSISESDIWTKAASRCRRGSPRKSLRYVALGIFLWLTVVFIRYYWTTYAAYALCDGFYNGVLSLVKYSEWIPEQGSAPNTTILLHDLPAFDPVVVNPYPAFDSVEYLAKYYPVQECYVVDETKVAAPNVFAYPAIPANMPTAMWGSYEEIGIEPGRCWDRFGRLGSYGYSYSLAEGGLGLSDHSEHAGAEKVMEKVKKVDYRTVSWGKAQQRCFEKNSRRFDSRGASNPADKQNTESKKTTLKRSAYILRTWTGYDYTDIQILTLRAMVNELSLKSGGEYDVHLLVHVKNNEIPIWDSSAIYQEVLKRNVPEEFWGIATLWSEQQMQTYYGSFAHKDNLANPSGEPNFGAYRTAHFSLQWFAQQHPEYDFYWNWEMDVRYTGHYFEFHDGVSKWAAKQPRKLLWERNSKFWIPQVHGSWQNFSKLIENETMWSGEKPIWGAVKFPTLGRGMLDSPNATLPPTSFDEDGYDWGVGEDADLIVFNPLFDPDKLKWYFRSDLTGYDQTLEPPPRRSSIITVSRLSRRLLETMHEEVFRMRHTMFPEMWAPSIALHHSYKAVYVPHPVFFERDWPPDVVNQLFNYPETPRRSPFSNGGYYFKQSTFYFNADFSGVLWRRWLGATENGKGGRKFEEDGSGRMCLQGLLHHPVKHERIE